MTKKKQQLFLKMILIFVILQPIFDILSRGAILGIIPNISKYLKPLFVFGLTGYLLIFHSPKKKRWLCYILLFIILAIGHTLILSKLLVDQTTLLHELRFLLNIAYMLSIYISLNTIIYYVEDKENAYRRIKKTVFYTFVIYFSLYAIAIVTGTSGMTYEIADANKLGFKGWYDSGQILGHAYSMMLPLLMYVTLDPKRKWYIRGIIIILYLISASLLGTRVPYFITIIVLILYLIITIFIKAFNKDHKPNFFNIGFIFIMLIVMMATHKYIPVKYNMDLNTKARGTAISTYDLNKEAGVEIADRYLLEELYPGQDISDLLDYNLKGNEASNYLIELFTSEKLHPSNMRAKQIRYAIYKYKVESFKYKIFGLGFLNQNGSLALESDFTMALFSFGILGFILFLIFPIKEFLSSTIYILKHLKIVDLETYMLYMGLGIFFAISIYAGYTYIYTNFSIFLILLIIMLKLKKDTLKRNQINKNKISFLMLHLGYGGIETSVINTANALCDKYDIELVSFYNLNKNQTSRISKKINIKYLYNGEPNREEIKNSIKNHKYLSTIKEGIKAINILIKKKLLIIKEIIKSNSQYIISTRYEFSILLSKYGNASNIKIAQEHHYHNNDKKYINILKKKYYNIDYLFALTKTLEEDYKIFLKNNNHTKVVLMPNMIYPIPKEKSKLNSKNIITMSRLDPGKRNDEIIKIFSKIKNKDWNLYILGDGQEYNNLKELIKELNLEKRVFLEGYITKDKIPDYLLSSSIFLMASVTEGLPMVLLEAMSYGIPCIAYEIPSGVSDIIIDNYNGFIIKNRDEEEYIKKIELLIKDENKRKEFGNNTLKTIDNFDDKTITKKWEKILCGDINEKE